MSELKGWPMKDATIILVVEIVLMGALLLMNAAEQMLVKRELMVGHGSFPVSQYLVGLFEGISDGSVHMIERLCWWFHFVGIIVFLNYVPYSKHWHIIMSFPNVYYTPLKPKGELANLDYVTTEVKLMMDPSAQPPEGYEPPLGFGAKDVQDLTWKNLMDAYTCTECGRCSSVCPANQTGKLLSPRKVMMDTRDRLEEVGRGIDAAKKLAQQNGEAVTIAADNLHYSIYQYHLTLKSNRCQLFLSQSHPPDTGLLHKSTFQLFRRKSNPCLLHYPAIPIGYLQSTA
jgi:ferredoxin